MRKVLLGLVAAATLGLSGLVATPQTAAAQGFSITFGTGHPPIVRHDGGYRRYHAPPRRDWRRHKAQRHYGGRPRWRDCEIHIVRRWTGGRWVSRKTRVCY